MSRDRSKCPARTHFEMGYETSLSPRPEFGCALILSYLAGGCSTSSSHCFGACGEPSRARGVDPSGVPSSRRPPRSTSTSSRPRHVQSCPASRLESLPQLASAVSAMTLNILVSFSLLALVVTARPLSDSPQSYVSLSSVAFIQLTSMFTKAQDGPSKSRMRFKPSFSLALGQFLTFISLTSFRSPRYEHFMNIALHVLTSSPPLSFADCFTPDNLLNA